MDHSFESEVTALRAESDAFRKLLSEAVKIIHANSRNINKDWLSRARATLRGYARTSACGISKGEQRK